MTSTSVWLAVAVLSISVASLACLGRGKRPSEDPDLLVLRQLEKAGSDLSKPHSPDFFLFFNSADSAREAARRLEADGYAVKAEAGASGDGTWVCQATRSLVLEHATLVSIRRSLKALAEELGGKYDGWGTEVVE